MKTRSAYFPDNDEETSSNDDSSSSDNNNNNTLHEYETDHNKRKKFDGETSFEINSNDRHQEEGALIELNPENCCPLIRLSLKSALLESKTFVLRKREYAVRDCEECLFDHPYILVFDDNKAGTVDEFIAQETNSFKVHYNTLLDYKKAIYTFGRQCHQPSSSPVSNILEFYMNVDKGEYLANVTVEILMPNILVELTNSSSFINPRHVNKRTMEQFGGCPSGVLIENDNGIFPASLENCFEEQGKPKGIWIAIQQCELQCLDSNLILYLQSIWLSYHGVNCNENFSVAIIDKEKNVLLKSFSGTMKPYRLAGLPFINLDYEVDLDVEYDTRDGSFNDSAIFGKLRPAVSERCQACICAQRQLEEESSRHSAPGIQKDFQHDREKRSDRAPKELIEIMCRQEQQISDLQKRIEELTLALAEATSLREIPKEIASYHSNQPKEICDSPSTSSKTTDSQSIMSPITAPTFLSPKYFKKERNDEENSITSGINAQAFRDSNELSRVDNKSEFSGDEGDDPTTTFKLQVLPKNVLASSNSFVDPAGTSHIQYSMLPTIQMNSFDDKSIDSDEDNDAVRRIERKYLRLSKSSKK